jgi:hypothetical protein
MIKVHPFHLVIIAFILIIFCSLAHCQTPTDTTTQLQSAIDKCKYRVDSLQALPNMPVKEFYVAAKNLSLARATLLLFVAKKDPDRATMATKTAGLYQKRAVAFAEKAGD